MKKIQKILLIIGSLLLLNAVIMTFLSNFSAGILLFAVASIALIIYAIFFGKLKKGWHITIWIACLIPLIFMITLAVYGSRDNAQFNEDAAIVLGAGIRGEKVGGNLAARLDKAAEYHSKNPDAVIAVCGGQGPQEAITEALAMERYLIEKGVPQEKIIREEQSTSTYENFLFAKEILDGRFPQGYSGVLITSDFHVYRAAETAKAAGISAAHIGARTKWYNVTENYLREMLAVAWMWVS